MKLSDVSVDPVRVEQGEWISDIPDLGDLRVKVRGTNNAIWRSMSAKLVAAIPRNKKVGGRIDPDEADRINVILLVETSLLDWDGINDDDDKPVPFSKPQAKAILSDPKYRKLYEGVLWAAMRAGEGAAEKQEEQIKN